MSTFVSVGNAHQSFGRLLQAVDSIAGLLPQPVLVQYGHTSFQSKVCEGRAFFEMLEFEQLITSAELVISHAGVGGVLLAVQSGRIPVVMPRLRRYGEHVDDHQVENARALVLSRKAVVASEPSSLITAVEEAMKMQSMAKPTMADPPMVNMIRALLREYAERARK